MRREGRVEHSLSPCKLIGTSPPPPLHHSWHPLNHEGANATLNVVHSSSPLCEHLQQFQSGEEGGGEGGEGEWEGEKEDTQHSTPVIITSKHTHVPTHLSMHTSHYYQ